MIYHTVSGTFCVWLPLSAPLFHTAFEVSGGKTVYSVGLASCHAKIVPDRCWWSLAIIDTLRSYPETQFGGRPVESEGWRFWRNVESMS